MSITWQMVRVDNLLQQQHDEKFNVQDGSVEQTATQTWRAVTTNLAATCGDALSATDGTGTIPTLGSYYDTPAGPWFICIHRMPKQTGKGTFDVQVEYYRKIAFKPAGDKWSATISFGGIKFTEKAHKDNFGNAIINSAGISFDPGIQRTYQDERFDLSYKTTTPPDLRPYRSMVNSVAITFNIAGISRTYQPRQLLFDDGTMSTTVTLGDGTTNVTPSTAVWDIKLSFASRTVGAAGGVDGYVDRILDEGYEQLPSAGPAKGGGVNDSGLSYASLLTALATTPAGGAGSTQVVKMRDSNGQYLSSPGRLDGTGLQATPDSTPVFLAFAVEGQADLSALFTGF